MSPCCFPWQIQSVNLAVSIHIPSPHSPAWDISMDISFSSLGYFIVIFIWIPSWFQWIFHFHPWDISLNLLGSMWDDGHMTTTKIAQKIKVVALCCTFQNLFELCFEVLPWWRYDVKDFEKHCVFFFLFFCIFFHENQTKQHDFTTFRKLEERATIIVSWEKWLKKGRCMPYSALHVRLEFKSHEKLFVLVVCDWCHAAGFRSGNCVVLRNT